MASLAALGLSAPPGVIPIVPPSSLGAKMMQTASTHFKDNMSLKGMGKMNLAFVALQMATAPKGNVASAAFTGAISIPTYAIFEAVIAAGLAVIPGLNPLGITILASLGAMYLQSNLDEKMIPGVQALTEIGARSRRMEMGGNFQDDQSSQQLRMSAISEMSGSMQPSRRYLGQEARFLHR